MKWRYVVGQTFNPMVSAGSQPCWPGMPSKRRPGAFIDSLTATEHTCYYSPDED